jgi:hypothetical protein
VKGPLPAQRRIPHLLPLLSAWRITLLLTLAALAAGVQASTPSPARAMTLAQVDGGPNYYARFSHGLPTSRSYFPISVWLESVLSQADIDKDKNAGLNTYLGLTANSDLGLVRSSGMHAIVQIDEFGAHQAMQGWFLADEVDMTHGPSTGYAEMQRVANATPADGRVRYTNYGKGVLFWESDAEAARFVNDYQDIVAADAYFFTDENVCSGTEGGTLVAGGADLSPAECHRAANYGATVRRLRGLVSPAGSKPVWAVVELGHPFTESDWPTITPAQVRAAVWQSLIGGARGIVYFNHSFGGPHQTQHILRDGSDADSAYASIRSVARATNRQIDELAPVLNSPTVRSGWSQRAGTTAMVKWAEGKKAKAKKRCKSKKKKKCKKKAKGKKAKAKKKCKSKKGKKCKKAKRKKTKGHLYVFAGSAGSPVEGRFSLPCVGDAQAAVVGENRTIPVRGGSFSDHFADGNAIHIYRIDGGSTCGLPREAKVPYAGLAGGGDPATSSNTVPWVIVAAIVVFLVGMLAFFRMGRLPKRARLRSGKRGKRTERLGIQ